MPQARRKPQPVNLHARRAKALGGENEVTINEKIPGPYSGTSCRAPEGLPPAPKPAPPPDPALTPATDEERELCAVAVKAVLATVRQARAAKKYAAYGWLGETEANQVAHAFGHVRELQNQVEGVRMREPNEPHAAHLVTRGVLLLALHARDQFLGGFGE